LVLVIKTKSIKFLVQFMCRVENIKVGLIIEKFPNESQVQLFISISLNRGEVCYQT